MNIKKYKKFEKFISCPWLANLDINLACFKNVLKKIISTVFIFLIITTTSTLFAGTIYYVDATNGNDVNPGTESLPWRTIQKAANTITAGDTVIVKEGIYDERVTESSNGSSGNFITFQANSGDTVTVSEGFVLSGNYIMIDGFNITCSNSGSDWRGCVHITGDNCIVANCTIEDAARPGILTTASSDNCTMANNTIRRCLLDGMQVYGRNHLIEDNEIYDIRDSVNGVTRDDANGFMFHGSGHIFRRNYIYGIVMANMVGAPHIDHFQTFHESSTSGAEAGHDCIFEKNHCHHYQPGHYTFMLEGTSSYPAHHLTIRNNLFEVGLGVCCGANWYQNNIYIYNNTFIGNPSITTGWPCAIDLSGVNSYDIRNNITIDYKGNGSHRYISGGSGTVANNAAWNSDGSTPYGVPNAQPNEIWGINPQFFDFIAAGGGNYHLASNSPCIDTGAHLSGIVDDDYDGYSRPYGGWYDIGAYEYVGENPLLDANADASPTSGETPLAVNFTGNATGGTSPYSYSWDFGDGQSSFQQNPSHTFYTAGNYSVFLTVTDSNNNQDSDSLIITVTDTTSPLVASSSASPTSGDSPLAVYFTGNATGGIPPYTYYWSFGDGQSSSQQNPSHTYNNAGNYTATLTVTDSNNIQDSDSLIITVTAPIPSLIASSSASPTSGDSPLTVYFTGNATGGAPPYGYYWNFGDGQSSTQQNPSYTYNNAGNYTATLTVTDTNSSQDSDSLIITVTTPAPPPLVASCIASPTSGNAPFTVYFTGNASGGTPPYSYSWNFGDGSFSTQQNPSHIYNAAGNYIVTLTVTDSQSLQDSVSLSITANLSPTQAYLSCSPANFYFGASVSGTQPSSQSMRIINAGDGTMTWNVQESTSWLSCSPLSGTNRGQVTVSVNTASLSPGTYNAIITASSPQAYNSPQLIAVNLRVYEAGVDIPDGNPFSGRDSVVGLTLNDIKARRAGIKKNSDPNNPTEAIESGGLVSMGNTFIAEDSTEKGNLERPELNTPYQQEKTGRLTIGLKEIQTGLKPQSAIDKDTEENRIMIDHAERPVPIEQKPQLENKGENINIKRVQIEEMEPLRIIFTSNLGENLSFIGWGEDEQILLPIGSTLDTVKGEFSWIPPFGSKGIYMFHFAVTDGSQKSQPLRIEVHVIRKDTIIK